MKYTNIAKGALALVLGVVTSSVFAANIYEESFETISTNSKITTAKGAPWTAGADDISRVVVASYTYTPDKPLNATNHTKVLQLNTEGGTLTNAVSGAAFSAANIYVDTMVKCVPSEDTPVFADSAIKVAVYAKISSTGNATNLAIYHGTFYGGAVGSTNTVTSLKVNPNNWYRLTIELANGSGDTTKQALEISIDGIPITNAAAYTDDWQARINAMNVNPNTGTWFLSAATSSKTDISALQFKGTGFIDDLVVTASNPFGVEWPEEYSAPVIAWLEDNEWTPEDIAENTSGLTIDEVYLFNLDATDAAATGTIEITGIEIVADQAVVTVKITRSASMTGDINGTLSLYGWTELNGTRTLIDQIDIDVGTDADTTQNGIEVDVTFTGAAAYKFFKAVISE